MKSVIRSRMYSVFQNDVPGDRKQKCVENKRITTNTRFSQFSNLDQILFYVKFVHFYENNSLRSILHFTLDEKLPNSIYSKKKKRKKSWKDTVPLFSTPLEPHTLSHPVHDETAHTSLDPTMSAIRRRGNGGAIGEEGERARYITERIECRRSERGKERAQRLPPIDFCALAVNSRVLLYATPSPHISLRLSTI